MLKYFYIMYKHLIVDLRPFSSCVCVFTMSDSSGSKNLLLGRSILFMYSLLFHVQLTLKVLKFKTLNPFSFYVLFNTSIAQHVSAYFAIIRCIKIEGGIATVLYTVITRVDVFS
jgi:hypothetical protein